MKGQKTVEAISYELNHVMVTHPVMATISHEWASEKHVYPVNAGPYDSPASIWYAPWQPMNWGFNEDS